MTKIPNAQDIENAIERWHRSDSVLGLPDWLGWARDEYDAWVQYGIIPQRPLPPAVSEKDAA